MLGQLAGNIATKASNVVTVVDAVVDVFKLATATSNGERIVAGMDLASDLAYLAFDLGKVGQAGPAALALAIGSKEFQLVVNQIGDTELAIAYGLLQQPLATITDDGLHIAACADQLETAQLLVNRSQTAEQQAAMQRMITLHTKMLAQAVDRLISDAHAPDLEAGMANHPGSYALLRDALAEVSAYKGVKTPAQAQHATRIATERVRWVLEHAARIIQAAALGESIDYVTADEPSEQHDE